MRFSQVGAAALIALAFTAGTAHASTSSSIGQTTENRPSTVESGGAEYIAWAGTDSAGEVNVAKLTSGMTGVSDGPWTYSGSSTYIGAGPTLTATKGGAGGTSFLVVAYANGSGQVEVDAVNPNDTGSNSGYECQTQVGNSTDTPYITSEGDDGTGDLYLAYVNSSQNNEITVERLNPSQCNGSSGSIPVSSSYTVTSDTSWSGPALIPDGFNGTGGSATLYVAWAGTNSAHNLNIAKYSYGATTFASKTVESSHSTTTDLGGAYDTATGQNWVSYCGSGTSNYVYYQSFAGNAGGTEMTTGAKCDVTIYNGYYSGGVGVGYDYSGQATWLSYADTSTNLVTVTGVPPSTPSSGPPPVNVGSDDYPWSPLCTYGECGSGTVPCSGNCSDPWGMAYGQCVSFVAWKLYELYGGTQRPSPAQGTQNQGWAPSNPTVNGDPVTGWGSAKDWATDAANARFTVTQTPAVDDVAQWDATTADQMVPNGHVMMVVAVNPGVSITVAGYNTHPSAGGGKYGEWTIKWDDYNWEPGNSYGNTPPWPTNFLVIHP
jgi:surface antigen